MLEFTGPDRKIYRLRYISMNLLEFSSKLTVDGAVDSLHVH